MKLRLWEGRAPGAVGDGPGDVPEIAVYLAGAGANGSAVVVCPGGGYGHLAAHEGEPVARWLNGLGIAGVVLKYRHGPAYRHPAPLADVSRAIRTVRARAAAWGLDAGRVGVMGFSAGGHLAATVSTRFDRGDAASDDPVEREASRPDLSVLVYPVITLGGASAHTGSQNNLIGPDASADLIERLSAERQVTAETPATFLFHTTGDAVVPVENTLMYAAALRSAGVGFELHVYDDTGRHGVGLATEHAHLGTWPGLCGNWLRKRWG